MAVVPLLFAAVVTSHASQLEVKCDIAVAGGSTASLAAAITAAEVSL